MTSQATAPSAKSLKIENPTNNAARCFNSGIDDARANRFRRPVESMYGAYCRGWLKVRPLPEGECWSEGM